MKRKYYMRGLGFGILITAILCAVALPNKAKSISDAEVIARAKELGYVKKEEGVTAEDINKIKDNEKVTGTPQVTGENDVTPPVTDVSEETPGPTPTPDPTPAPPDAPEEPEKPASSTPKPTEKATPAPKATATATPKPTITVVPTKTPGPTATAVPTKTPSSGAYTVTVERGATAQRVADRLEEMGAIADADAFVSYLKKQNLTDFINIGKFTIPQGASHADIAKILTGR